MAQDREDGRARSDADLDAVSEAPLVRAKRLLERAAVGSCTCNAASPELVWHAQDCRYAVLMDALDAIEESEGVQVSSGAGVPALDAAGPGNR